MDIDFWLAAIGYAAIIVGINIWGDNCRWKTCYDVLAIHQFCTKYSDWSGRPTFEQLMNIVNKISFTKHRWMRFTFRDPFTLYDFAEFGLQDEFEEFIDEYKGK